MAEKKVRWITETKGKEAEEYQARGKQLAGMARAFNSILK